MKSFFQFLNTCDTEHVLFYLAALLIAFCTIVFAVTKVIIEVVNGVIRVITTFSTYRRNFKQFTTKNDNTAAQ